MSIRFILLFLFFAAAARAQDVRVEKPCKVNTSSWSLAAGYLLPTGTWTQEAHYSEATPFSGLRYGSSFNGLHGIHTGYGLHMALSFKKMVYRNEAAKVRTGFIFSPLGLGLVHYDLSESGGPARSASDLKPFFQYEMLIGFVLDYRMKKGAVLSFYGKTGITIKKTAGKIYFAPPPFTGEDYDEHIEYTYNGGGVAFVPGIKFETHRCGISFEVHKELSISRYYELIYFKDYLGNSPDDSPVEGEDFLMMGVGFLDVSLSYTFLQ